MAESTVDITADREKAAAAGKAAAKAFADSFAREIQATQKLGRMQASAYAEDERRTATKSRAKETEHRKEVQRTQQLGRIQRDEEKFREQAARRTLNFAATERATLARTQLQYRSGASNLFGGIAGGAAKVQAQNVAGSRNLGAGIEAAARDAIAKRGALSQSRYDMVERGAYAGVGLAGLAYHLISGEKDKSYEAHRQSRIALGENVGPLNAGELLAGNKATTGQGIAFNIPYERRLAMQNMLARQVGSGAGAGNLINISKGGLGISAEQGAVFAGDLQRFTGKQGAAVWQEFRSAMVAADKVGMGRGRFAKFLDPVLKLYEVSAKQRGGDARTGDVSSMLSVATDAGFRRERAASVGGAVRSGLAATGRSPLTLMAFGMQKHGAAGALWRSQMPGSDKEAIAWVRDNIKDPTAAAMALQDMTGVGLVEAGKLLYGGAGMRSAGRTGIPSDQAYGAGGARAGITSATDFAKDARIAETRRKLGAQVSNREEIAQARQRDVKQWMAAGLWGDDETQAPMPKANATPQELETFKKQLAGEKAGLEAYRKRAVDEARNVGNTSKKRIEFQNEAQKATDRLKSTDERMKGVDSELKFRERSGRAPMEGERETLYEQPSKLDELIRETKRNGGTLDAIRRGQDQ